MSSKGVARGTDQGEIDNHHEKGQEAGQPWVGSVGEENLSLDFKALMFLLSFFKDSLREEIF